MNEELKFSCLWAVCDNRENWDWSLLTITQSDFTFSFSPVWIVWIMAILKFLQNRTQMNRKCSIHYSCFKVFGRFCNRLIDCWNWNFLLMGRCKTALAMWIHPQFLMFGMKHCSRILLRMLKQQNSMLLSWLANMYALFYLHFAKMENVFIACSIHSIRWTNKSFNQICQRLFLNFEFSYIRVFDKWKWGEKKCLPNSAKYRKEK